MVSMSALEQLRTLCLALPGVFVDYPFGPDAAVYKIKPRSDNVKMFALIFEGARDAGGAGPTINLKCDPELAVQLRTQYEYVRPGYHMSKKHWNSVDCGGSVDWEFVGDLIEDSYDLVVSGLKRSDQESLGWRRVAQG